LTVPFCVSSSACPVLPNMFFLSFFSSCPVLPVQFCLSCLPLQFCLSYSACLS
jgi:hypothetical protein